MACSPSASCQRVSVESPEPVEPTRVNGAVRIFLMRMEVGWSLVFMDELDELLMGLNSHNVRKSARFFLHFVRFIFNFFCWRVGTAFALGSFAQSAILEGFEGDFLRKGIRLSD